MNIQIGKQLSVLRDKFEKFFVNVEVDYSLTDRKRFNSMSNELEKMCDIKEYDIIGVLTTELDILVSNIAKDSKVLSNSDFKKERIRRVNDTAVNIYKKIIGEYSEKGLDVIGKRL